MFIFVRISLTLFMRNLIFLFFLVGLLFSNNAIAQYENNDIGLSVRALAMDYISQNGGDFTAYNQYHTGMELTFLKKMSDNVYVGVPLKIGVVQSPEGIDGLNSTILSIDATGRYQFARPNAKVLPYVLAGVGYVYEPNGTSHIQIPAGIGFNFRIHDRAFVTWQSEYRYALEDDRNNLHHGLGFTYFLGPKDPPKMEKEKKEMEEKEELDSDGDGIIDELDLCPQEAGIEELDGCPDKDGDGIADYKDLCPDQAGTMEMKGCPDTDGDGVADNEDECPNMIGTIANNGCPDNDADNDGIPNDLDKCPTVAGPATNGGCPELDSDGDGVPDNIDNCPNTAGSKNTLGCPDQDGDGIPDSNDNCPTVKGSPLNNGCPDTTNNDRDGDGIPDSVDKCPDQAGLSLYNGCPDTDGDGIDDSEDACPNQPGPAVNKGCPGGNNQTNIPSNDIDTDGDGIMDSQDKCPNQPGLAVYGGCPDTDGDGIDDSRDRCPTAAGPVDTGGCPEVAASDRRILDIAMRSIQFETAKAEIKSESFVYLTQIGEIMDRYPDFNLSIEGHTDDQGPATENQVLSERRARACYNFLISSGVSRERMSYAGYGESRPIATNQTVSGRTLNRRVEFALIPKY